MVSPANVLYADRITYNEAKPYILVNIMIIHVAGEGETINSIARLYGLSAERLALENGIDPAVNLAVGETIVILFPEIVYTVQNGDTLSGIASAHNISIMELLRNNPYLVERRYIYPGETVVIKYEDAKIGQISTNGYVYPFVNLEILRMTLPFLTFLSIYGHAYTSTGDIIDINDSEIIHISREYGVAPIMVLTGFATGPMEEIALLHDLLINPELQDNLIANLLNILARKEYYGVSFTTPYISPPDRRLYIEFIGKLSARLKAGGYKVFLTLTRSSFDLLTNVDYESLRYDILGVLVDNVIIITYEWGFAYALPPTIVAFDTLNNFTEYGISLIDSKKLEIGFSTIGYIWRLPFIEGVVTGQSITYNSAVSLAREYDAVIRFDDITRASYFQYFSDYEYIVRFRDARGINEILHVVPEYGVEGVSIWNVMYFFNQLYLLLNSQFDIKKVIPFDLPQ